MDADPKPMIMPRDYQAKAFSLSYRAFDRGYKRVLVTMATGTGKTILFGLSARCEIEDYGGRVLVLAHTDELIRQASAKLISVGLDPVIEKAGERALGGNLFGEDANCVVGSVQTMQGGRLRAWPKDYFSKIVIDEAHHYTFGSRYDNIVNHFNAPRILGVTATAVRADKTPLVGANQPWETIAFDYPMEEAIADGWLKPPFYEMVPTAVDLSALREGGGDYNPEELAALLMPHVEKLVNDSRPYIGDRRFICFTPTIASASAVASAYSSIGLPCEYVYGGDPERDSKLSGFANARFRGLVNAAVLTEGYDAPWCSSVVLMRPTKSWALFMQMVGRGTRLFAGDVDCQVLGFNWKTLGHKLIHPVELVNAGKRPAAVVDEAREMVEKGEETDLFRALQRAEETVKERERIRLEVAARAAQVKSIRVDPFTGRRYEPRAMDANERGDRKANRPATPGQIGALHKFKFRFDESTMGFVQAKKTLDYLVDRAKKGLATEPQLRALGALGMPRKEAIALTMPQASAEIDRRQKPTALAG